MKGYRTLVFAGLVAASGFLASPEMTAWAAEQSEYVGVFIGICIAGLRVITTSPMLKKESADVHPSKPE